MHVSVRVFVSVCGSMCVTQTLESSQASSGVNNNPVNHPPYYNTPILHLVSDQAGETSPQQVNTSNVSGGARKRRESSCLLGNILAQNANTRGSQGEAENSLSERQATSTGQHALGGTAHDLLRPYLASPRLSQSQVMIIPYKSTNVPFISYQTQIHRVDSCVIKRCSLNSTESLKWGTHLKTL